jgi:hypothetical protein
MIAADLSVSQASELRHAGIELSADRHLVRLEFGELG